MEEVLVVKRSDLQKKMTEVGFITREMPDILEFILENYFFEPRDKAEYDPELKQIIPYVIIHQNDRFFLLRRLNRQTESRLHDRLSLGIGGHINPTEQSGASSIVEAGMQRELEEEVFVEKTMSLQCLGILNDNSGGVNDYHLGVVYLLDAEGEVSVRETEKMEGTWATLPMLEECVRQMESWSQLVLEVLLCEKAKGREAFGILSKNNK